LNDQNQMGKEKKGGGMKSEGCADKYKTNYLTKKKVRDYQEKEKGEGERETGWRGKLKNGNIIIFFSDKT